jgi:phenylpropionate dioxygenase-like ring-hydroxylating dioxygenase large terminal subunit
MAIVVGGQPTERNDMERFDHRMRFPFAATPIGWYVMARSSELPPGAVLPLRYFGRDLVLFRTESGEAKLLDAFCPHLGAHLGHGGTVCGESIRCPFHGWCFDGNGQCSEIPNASRRRPTLTIPSWPLCERNGLIFVYHHPAGAEPSWDVPVVPEFESDAWTPVDLRRWTIRTHVHEMCENAFDMTHFHQLHGLLNLPEPEYSFDGPRFQLHMRTVMDTPLGHVDGALDIRSFGFGFGMGRFSGLIDTLLVTAVTPIDDERVDARFLFTVKKLPDEGATRMVGTGFVDELSRQVEQDIRVWEHKRYLERPVYGEQDGPIAAFRRWARQFYVEEAPAATVEERHLVRRLRAHGLNR